MTPSTYQDGTIVLRKRKRQPDVYEFRYREYMVNGTFIYKRETLGTVKELPNKKALMEKVEEARARINAGPRGIFFKDVAAQYKRDVLPALRPRTQATNLGNLVYLETEYGARRINDITPGELDAFLNSLKSRGIPRKGGELWGVGRELSKATRQHIKALAHNVWRHAMLWGYASVDVPNPVSIARITRGARPKVKSTIVSPVAYAKLLEDKELPLLVKTMVQVAMITGLRVSEILGLRWEDVDFSSGTIHVRRSSVGKHIDETKNEASENDVPMHQVLAQALRAWKKAEPVFGGYVFGSPLTNRPYHEMNLHRKHLKPAGQRAGIANLGWHSFRHTHSADLEVAGASDRVQQASMRHGDAAMTKHYGKHSPALFEKMRKAQAKVVSILTTKPKRTGTRG